MSDRTTHSGLLVGVDGSTPSLSAVRWATYEAAMRNVPLTLVHAICETMLSSATSGWSAGPGLWLDQENDARNMFPARSSGRSSCSADRTKPESASRPALRRGPPSRECLTRCRVRRSESGRPKERLGRPAQLIGRELGRAGSRQLSGLAGAGRLVPGREHICGFRAEVKQVNGVLVAQQGVAVCEVVEVVIEARLAGDLRVGRQDRTIGSRRRAERTSFRS
jgi:Universal stress protein family